MSIIQLLLDSDPSVRRMTQKYLLGTEQVYVSDGWIGNFLSLFDARTQRWGGGIYGPKWISTFYTLRDLMSLEIDPKDPVYQAGLQTLLNNMWKKGHSVEDDVCVVAMMVSMLSYGSYDSEPIEEMMDYLISKQLSDGGWNCSSRSKVSSVHTTLSVLEAYRDYLKFGYSKNLPMLNKQAHQGREYLLNKRLLRRETTGELLFNQVDSAHFPVRWKYDYLRALVYFTSIEYPYDPRLDEALALLKEKMKGGTLGKGTTYSGRLHFKMETETIGKMNTLRGLMVLKHYDPPFYQNCIKG